MCSPAWGYPATQWTPPRPAGPQMLVFIFTVNQVFRCSYVKMPEFRFEFDTSDAFISNTQVNLTFIVFLNTLLKLNTYGM